MEDRSRPDNIHILRGQRCRWRGNNEELLITSKNFPELKKDVKTSMLMMYPASKAEKH